MKSKSRPPKNTLFAKNMLQGLQKRPLTDGELQMIEEIFSRAVHKYLKTAPANPSLNEVMECYKAALKARLMDPSKDTILYKAILKICMTKKKMHWEEALKRLRAANSKAIYANQHYETTLMQKHFYYWIFTIHMHRAEDINKSAANTQTMVSPMAEKSQTLEGITPKYFKSVTPKNHHLKSGKGKKIRGLFCKRKNPD